VELASTRPSATAGQACYRQLALGVRGRGVKIGELARPGSTNVGCHVGTRRPVGDLRLGVVDDFERVRAALRRNQRDAAGAERRVHDHPAVGLERASGALKSLRMGHPRSGPIGSPNAASIRMDLRRIRRRDDRQAEQDRSALRRLQDHEVEQEDCGQRADD